MLFASLALTLTFAAQEPPTAPEAPAAEATEAPAAEAPAPAASAPAPPTAPEAPAASAPMNKDAEIAAAANAEREHIMQAAATVGIAAGLASIGTFAVTIPIAFYGSIFVGYFALLPVVAVPLVIGVTTYLVSRWNTGPGGAIVNTAGALGGHYLGLVLGIVGGAATGLIVGLPIGIYLDANGSGGGVVPPSSVLLPLGLGALGGVIGAGVGGGVGAGLGGALPAFLTTKSLQELAPAAE
jgi:hypothetical protein